MMTLLPVAVIAELLAVATGVTELGYLACVLFLVYFILRFRTLGSYARVLGIITLAVLVGVGLMGRMSLAALADTAGSSAYYATFLGSLGLMQSLVRRFEVLRRVHDLLLGGNPGLLYPKYALTSCGVASVLNFSVISVLCGSLYQTLDERGIDGQQRRRVLRSLLTVTLRGFALVPLVAPTSVAVAILTREVPGLTWLTLLPYTVFAALVFIGIGWIIEAPRLRRVSRQRVVMEHLPKGTGILVGCVTLLLSGMAAIVTFTDLGVSQAAMLSIPTLTLGYLLFTERRPAEAGRELTGNLGGMQSEMFIFGCSAALGGTLASLVPAAAIADYLAQGHWEFACAVAGMLLVMLGAMIGIVPITVLTFLAGILAQLQQVGMSPLIIGIALVIGFSMAMLLAPFGPAVMILAKFGRVSSFTVAFGWNGFFAMVALPVMLGLVGLGVFFSIGLPT